MSDAVAAVILVLLFFACCTKDGLNLRINGQNVHLKIENIKGEQK